MVIISKRPDEHAKVFNSRLITGKDLGNKSSELNSFSGIHHLYCKQKTGISTHLGKVALFIVVVVTVGVIFKTRI